MTVYSDHQMMQHVHSHSMAYNTAEQNAYQKISEIDKLAAASYSDTENKTVYINNILATLSDSDVSVRQANNDFTLSFSERIDEKQTLRVTLNLNYPETATDTFLSIIEWKTINENTETIEEPLHLYQKP